MPIDAQYDPEVDALYVRLSDAPVARTVEAEGPQNVDISAQDEVVGLELLAPVQMRQLAATAEVYGFEHRLGEIQQAILHTVSGPKTYYSQASAPLVLTGAGTIVIQEQMAQGVVFSTTIGDRSVDLDPAEEPELA